MAARVAAKKPPSRKGRTKAPQCYVRGCRGAARPGHFATATHRKALAALQVERGGPADENRLYRNRSTADVDAYYDSIAPAPVNPVDWLIDHTAPPEPAADYDASMALITLREAARRLELKPDSLKHAIRRGRMVGHKYGRDWLVEESEVRYYEMTSLGKVGWPKGRPRKRTTERVA